MEKIRKKIMGSGCIWMDYGVKSRHIACALTVAGFEPSLCARADHALSSFTEGVLCMISINPLTIKPPPVRISPSGQSAVAVLPEPGLTFMGSPFTQCVFDAAQAQGNNPE
jgi:hypothetical protein